MELLDSKTLMLEKPRYTNNKYDSRYDTIVLYLQAHNSLFLLYGRIKELLSNLRILIEENKP
jgi:hypothetical protein